MITQYFDVNQRTVVQSPGTLAPASSTNWVYGDNYNLAIYLVSQGLLLGITAGDSLGLILYEPGGTLPETNLAIISSPVIKTDAAGYQYFSVNVNLKTTGLASLVQSPNAPAKTNFHYTFNPAGGERFSSSADVAITVVPDPTEDATGATPVPPGYPADPSVFELKGNKGIANGYAGLDGTGKVATAALPAVELLANKNQANGYLGLDANILLNPSRIPIDATLQIVTGKLGAVSGGNGDMLRSTYDPDHDGIVSQAAAVPWTGVTGKPATFPPDSTAELVANKGQPNGYAGLDANNLLNPSRVPVDGTTITVAASKLAAIIATASAPGIVKPDGITITVDGTGKIVAATGIGQHGCRIWKSTLQAYAGGSALSFDTNSGTGLFDTDTFWASGNPTRITIPAAQAGYYHVGVTFFWDSGQTGGTYRYCKIALNGNVNSVVAAIAAPIVPSQHFMSVNAIYKFVAGDYIEIYPTTDATNQNIGTYGGATNHYSPCFFALRIA